MGDTEAPSAGSDREAQTGEEARGQLLEAFQHSADLVAQMGEWSELHHVLHRVLAALSPLRTHLRVAEHRATAPTDDRALLRMWRACQAELDQLADKGWSNTIGRSLGPDGTKNPPPDWGVSIAPLRREIGERLREEAWSVEGLIDLADEMEQACHCYLNLADRELRQVVEQMRRLHTCLLGGLQ